MRDGRVVDVLQVVALAPLDEQPHAVEQTERAMQWILHTEEEPGVEALKVVDDLVPSSLVAHRLHHYALTRRRP